MIVTPERASLKVNRGYALVLKAWSCAVESASPPEPPVVLDVDRGRPDRLADAQRRVAGVGDRDALLLGDRAGGVNREHGGRVGIGDGTFDSQSMIPT